MSTMLIMSCYTGFFNVRRGWQFLNTGPRFYLRLFRRTGWLWIYTSRTTDGRPFKPKKLSVPFLYPGVPAGLTPFRGLGRRNMVPILPPAHPRRTSHCLTISQLKVFRTRSGFAHTCTDCTQYWYCIFVCRHLCSGATNGFEATFWRTCGELYIISVARSVVLSRFSRFPPINKSDNNDIHKMYLKYYWESNPLTLL